MNKGDIVFLEYVNRQIILFGQSVIEKAYSSIQSQLPNPVEIAQPVQGKRIQTVNIITKSVFSSGSLEATQQALQRRKCPYLASDELSANTKILFSRGTEECCPELTTVYHQVARQFLGETALQAKAKDVRLYAESFVNNIPEDEVSKDQFVATIRPYGWNIFSHLLCGIPQQPKGEDSQMIARSLVSGALADDCLIKFMNKKKCKIGEDSYKLNREQIECFIKDLALPFTINTPYSVTFNVLSHLATLPEWQDHILNEQKESDEFSVDLLNFILETIRFDLPQPVVERGYDSIKLQGFADSAELVGANPEIFNPDRFRDETLFPGGVREWNGVKWLGFGYGAHKCVGSVVVKYLVATAVLELLKKYRIEPGEGKLALRFVTRDLA